MDTEFPGGCGTTTRRLPKRCRLPIPTPEMECEFAQTDSAGTDEGLSEAPVPNLSVLEECRCEMKRKDEAHSLVTLQDRSTLV